jgi:uncharacterized protein YndB with AHSA1/START domain
MTDVTSSRYDGIVERTSEGGVIRFERRLDFPIREVWDAITTPARLAEWWLPFDADITVDLREGGEMVFTATGDEPMTITCTILRVEPPMLLEHTHVDPGAYLRWELEPVGAGCVLRMSHFVSDADDAIEKCYVVGLHASLARLVPCLAGEPVPWDWNEFAVSQAQYAALGFAPEETENESE